MKKLRRSKNSVDPALRRKKAGGKLTDADKKKLELGELMEHEHGRKREKLEHDIEKIDQSPKKR